MTNEESFLGVLAVLLWSCIQYRQLLHVLYIAAGIYDLVSLYPAILGFAIDNEACIIFGRHQYNSRSIRTYSIVALRFLDRLLYNFRDQPATLGTNFSTWFLTQ